MDAVDAETYLKFKNNGIDCKDYSQESILEAYYKFDILERKNSNNIAFEDDIQNVDLGDKDLNAMVRSTSWKDYVKHIDPQILLLLRTRYKLPGDIDYAKNTRKDKDLYTLYMRQLKLCDYCIGLLKEHILAAWNRYCKIKNSIEEIERSNKEKTILQIKEQYPIPQGASDVDKLSVFYSRMAALLGEESFVQEGNNKTAEYMNLQTLKTEKIDRISDKEYQADWPIGLVKKALNIHSLDTIFGIKRERGDYATLVETENNDTTFHYKDIVACKVKEDEYFKSKVKISAIDGDFATKLYNLNIEDYQELFNDINQDRFKAIKVNIDSMKEKIAEQKVVFVDKEIYEDGARIIGISDMMVEELAFYVGIYEPDELLDKEVLFQRDSAKREMFPAETKLRNWLKNNSTTTEESSKDLKNVLDMAKKFYHEADEGNWTDEAYHLAFTDMTKAVHDWANKKDISQTEQGLRSEFINLYEEIYGKYNLKQVDSSLSKEIDACKSEDAEAEIFYDAIAAYEYKTNLDEATGEEEEKQCKEDYQKLKNNLFLDKSFVPLFAHKPCVEDIQQGGLGDCYMLAAIASIVKNNPDDISSMMTDLGSIVRVTFGDKTVYVSKKIYSQKSAKNVLWVQILEKAFAKAYGKEFSHINNDDDLRDKCKNYVGYVDTNKVPGMDPEGYLKKAFWSTTQSISSGGAPKDALNCLLGLKNSKQIRNRIAHVDHWDLAYDTLWNLLKKESNDKTNMNPDVKNFMVDFLKTKLLKELDNRFNITTGSQKSSRRAYTIDDIKDILLDMPNWKKQNNINVYYDLAIKMESRFDKDVYGDALKNIGLLCEEIMEAGLKQEKDERAIQYKTNLNSEKVFYTPQAIDTYNTIKEAVDKKIEIAAGTEVFSKLGVGLNSHGERINSGIVMHHVFTIVDCFNKDNHFYVTLRNPWGHGILQYTKKTGADGKAKIINGFKVKKDKNDGYFNVELNDFMNSFNHIDMVDAEERNAKRLSKEGKKEEKKDEIKEDKKEV